MSVEVRFPPREKNPSRLTRWSEALAGKRWMPPLALLAVCLAGYGLLAPSLGLYWDDWPVFSLVQQQDLSQLWEFYAFDRPISTWTFLVGAPLLGANLAAWQFFTIAARWLAGVGFWWLIRALWPDHPREALLAGALFCVYPSFLQQSVSVAYSQHFWCYALFTTSLAAMAWAARRPRWFLALMAYAVLADALQVFSMEYFAVLELLRPALLWLALRDRYPQRRRRLRATLGYWLPFALILAAFFVWRFIVYAAVIGNDGGNATLWLNRLPKQPIAALLDMAQMALQDGLHVLVTVWNNTLLPEMIALREKSFLLSIAAGGLVAALVGGLTLRMPKNEAGSQGVGQRASVESLALGLAAIVLGGLPVWVTDRQAVVGMWSDRFTLAPMLGACLTVIGVTGLLFRASARRVWIVAVMLGLAVALQIRTANEYRRNWDVQKTFYWQLAWRAPGIQPGTALLGTQMPFNLVGDYSIATALNLIYAPQAAPLAAPYWYLNAPRYRYGTIADFKPGLPIDYALRNYHFSGSTSAAVVVWDSSGPSCVRVLTPEDARSPGFEADVIDLTALSDPGRIDPNPAVPAALPAEIFGAEPAHSWCYYYEKADLARQTQAWQQVVDLGDQAFAAGLKPENGFELLPFVEGYAQAGRWDQAEDLTRQATALTDHFAPRLCAVWQRLAGETGEERVPAAMLAELGCAGAPVE